ncbi:nucleoside deaminase [Nocardioides carbamazepini]|uniref:nucleoside deaminase n=1 Tax=Nocardioides carbamazepini TaxID=2854259 RepID=UPI00214A6BB4|nr:nucleoside deaminase [Nocardioides carbamazepini]MCR1781064.1 nucleoside deaminase [Nocardioides carbamazepini]
MTISADDRRHLDRCVELAEAAVAAGDEPFGSVLVAADGTVLMEDHNHVSGGDGTRHPELAIALWAAAQVPVAERASLTVYTSGEHCAMCSAAHAWAGLGRIVFATSTPQLVQWYAELGLPASPVAALRIAEVAPGLPVDGPVEEYAERVRALHARHHAG